MRVEGGGVGVEPRCFLRRGHLLVLVGQRQALWEEPGPRLGGGGGGGVREEEGLEYVGEGNNAEDSTLGIGGDEAVDLGLVEALQHQLEGVLRVARVDDSLRAAPKEDVADGPVQVGEGSSPRNVDDVRVSVDAQCHAPLVDHRHRANVVAGQQIQDTDDRRLGAHGDHSGKGADAQLLDRHGKQAHGAGQVLDEEIVDLAVRDDVQYRAIHRVHDRESMDAVLQQSQRRTVQAFLRSYGNQGIAHRASHDSWIM